MPYSSVKDLPASVKVLPSKAERVWLGAFNSAYSKYGEDRARRIAWSAVKKSYHKNDTGTWVANSSTFTPIRVQVQLNGDGKIIQANTAGGGFVKHGVVLSSTAVNKQGFKYSDFALKTIANEWSGKSMKGRVEDANTGHDILYDLSRKGMSAQEIYEHLQSLDTDIEINNIRFENGVLVGDLHAQTIEPFKKSHISIETISPTESIRNNTYEQAFAVGFALTDDPNDTKAVI